MSVSYDPFWTDDSEEEPTDWKAVTGHVEHFVEQGRRIEAFTAERDDRLYGELIELDD